MQVVLEGTVRSVVGSRGAAGPGDLAVDTAVVATAPHAPCASLLLVIVPGFRCHGVLLPFAAFSLANIIPRLVFSHCDSCQLFDHCDGGPPQRWGSPRRRSSLYRHCIQSRLPHRDIRQIFGFSSFVRTDCFFAATVGLWCAGAFSLPFSPLPTLYPNLPFSIVMFLSSSFSTVFPAPPSSGMRPCALRLSGYELGRLPTLYPNSPLSSVILFQFLHLRRLQCPHCVACIAFSLLQLLRAGKCTNIRPKIAAARRRDILELRRFG